MTNLILKTDGYKLSHYLQYPPGTEVVYSYIESRNGKPTVFFGLQAFIKKYLTKHITIADIQEAEYFCRKYNPMVPFNLDGWKYIFYEHGGFLPITIKALPEGTVTNPRTVLLTVENNDPKCFWVTGHIETALLRSIWYSTTIASNTYHLKKKILEAYAKSSDRDISEADFKLHDFGARGVSSGESAELGGMAHLLNFRGSDTIEGVIAAEEYYNADSPGITIPASEHSTVTSWGRENEQKAFENMLDKFAKPGAVVANISDSYDIFNACEHIWGENLRERVINCGATIVIRPDSGSFLETPLACLDILSNKFGYSLNSKGYKVLPDYIRVIQGDGMNCETCPDLINYLLECEYSIDNLSFGMGHGLLQDAGRDDYGFAMKCSAIKINGVWQDVYKQPVSQSSNKASKRGRFFDEPLNLVYSHNRNSTYFVEENFETIKRRIWE